MLSGVAILEGFRMICKKLPSLTRNEKSWRFIRGRCTFEQVKNVLFGEKTTLINVNALKLIYLRNKVVLNA